MSAGKRWAAAIVAALFIGGLLQALHAPLPWLIGSLLAFAAANAMHAQLHVARPVRYAGQALVGTALGLYFTPIVLERVIGLSGWIALAAAASLGAGLLAARVLVRVSGTDGATAFFAGTAGGAAEMANQAEHFGARVDQVAAAQVVRVLLVVSIMPMAFKLTGLHGDDAYFTTQVPMHPGGLLLLLAAGGVAGALLARYSVPNGWLFGPLLVCAALTATGHALSSFPAWLVNCGQWLIGCSLGARFAPESFRDSPRFLLGVLASGGTLIAACAGIGVLVATLSGIPWPTLVLATAPGGLAEMGLTAKALKLGVPVVTAFHTFRLAVVVLTAGPAYRLLRRVGTLRD